jgi:hypothetical protein
MNRYIPAVMIMLLFSLSCIGSLSKNETLQNDKIDKKLRAEMEALNKQAYRYLAENRL